MKRLIKEEVKNAYNKPIINDVISRQYFNNTTELITNTDSANVGYIKADTYRLGSTKEIHEAAYIFLAIGFKLLNNKDIMVTAYGSNYNAEEIFHFAGHAFREIGQSNRAADAYWRAGILGLEKDKPSSLSIRSLARAKTAYAEIGEIDKSDKMHKLEWDARSQLLKGIQLLWIKIWGITCHYGTSTSRWFFSLFIFIFVFTAGYEILHAHNLIVQHQRWTFLITGLYYTLVTTSTVGYGEFVPSHPLSQCIVMMNIIFGYILLGVGLTILGRKALRR